MDVLFALSHPAALDFGNVYAEDVSAALSGNLINGFGLARSWSAVENAGETGSHPLFLQRFHNIVQARLLKQIFQSLDLLLLLFAEKQLFCINVAGIEHGRCTNLVLCVFLFCVISQVLVNLLFHLISDVKGVSAENSPVCHRFNYLVLLQRQMFVFEHITYDRQISVLIIIFNIIPGDAVITVEPKTADQCIKKDYLQIA